MSTPGLTVCLIIKNERPNLQEVLPDLVLTADDVVVVDTGSSDGSVELARALGARVFTHPWNDHFADARNRGLEEVGTSHAIWLDADDRIERSDLERVRAACLDHGSGTGFTLILDSEGAKPEFRSTCRQRNQFGLRDPKICSHARKPFPCDPERHQSCERPARLHAEVGLVFIGRIFDPAHVLSAQILPERLAANRKQRACPVDAVAVPEAAHRRQTVNPRLPRKLHQKGLCIVVGGVADHDMGYSVALRPARHEVISGAPGLIGDITRERAVGPFDGVVPDSQRFTKSRDEPRFVRRLWPQAMVHRDSPHQPATLCLKARREMQQRHGVAAARDGDSDHFRVDSAEGRADKREKPRVVRSGLVH